MPPKPGLFESKTRKFICTSCLSALHKRPIITPLAIRRSSQSANAIAPGQKKHRTPEQNAERIRTLEALGLLKDNSSQKVSVNYFEQGDNGAIHPVQDEEEFRKSLNDPGGELETRLKEFEDQLHGMTSMAKTIKEMGGKDEADKLLRQFALGPEDDDVDDLLDETENQSVSSLAIPISGLNGHRQDRMHRLNNWIRRGSRFREMDNVTPKDVLGLWKAYMAARPLISGRWDIVPTAAWEVLWKILSFEYPFDTNRMLYIYDLTRDIRQAGIALRPEQQILAIEAMFVGGWEKEAIENHRRHVATLGASPETFLPFWRLGMQMYCRVGDLERAERVANTILESSHEVDPRFILPLIKLCAETPAAVESGFKLYRDLRSILGSSMVIEDYDTIISYFLASGNTEHALFIFVDMMKSGSIDLSSAERYPTTIANPFFFGKWLKRLIGAGDLDGAFGVFRFMRSRKITPRAIQVNGLIGAWLRSGAADDAQQAEDVAWAMINARIQFVQLRKRKSRVPGVALFPIGEGWPRATLETFSLLAESYKERGLAAKMGPLWQSFQEAEIAPNSFILNQLLFSLLQDGQSEAVLPTYLEQFERFKVKPDSHTFMALWQALPSNRFVIIPPQYIEDEPSRTRTLFAEMLKHGSIFTSKDEDAVEIDHYLARTVLHSFRKIRDHAGVIVAYRALRRAFGYNPPDMVAFEILLGTMDLEKLTKRKEGIRLIRVRSGLDYFLEKRRQELVELGELNKGEKMPIGIRMREAGNYLELKLEDDFARSEGADAQRLAIEAAEGMGLRMRATQEPDIPPDS